jgi:hypothetical protein
MPNNKYFYNLLYLISKELVEFLLILKAAPLNKALIKAFKHYYQAILYFMLLEKPT